MKEEIPCRAARLQFLSVMRFCSLVSAFHPAWPLVREAWADASSAHYLCLLAQWKSLHEDKTDRIWERENTCTPDLWSGLHCIPTFTHMQTLPHPNEDLLPISTSIFLMVCLFFSLTGQGFSLLHPQVLLSLNFTNFKYFQKLFPKPAIVKQIRVVLRELVYTEKNRLQ